MEAFDMVVVDAVKHQNGYVDVPGNEARALSRKGTTVLAYVSLGTLEPWRHYASQAQGDWLLGPVPNFPTERFIDARAPGWQDLLVEEARALDAAGFDGLYLDNLDVVTVFPDSQPGMIELVQRLRTAAPELLLVAQNGLAIADRIPIDAIALEDLFWRWDQHRYRPSTTEETASQLSTLRNLRLGAMPVFTLDYMEPGNPAAQLVLMRSLAEGFHPVVTVAGVNLLPHGTPPCPNPI